MTSSTPSDRYEMTEEEQKRELRRAELGLAISNAILVSDKMLDKSMGKFKIEDVICVLARLTLEWSKRLKAMSGSAFGRKSTMLGYDLRSLHKELDSILFGRQE